MEKTKRLFIALLSFCLTGNMLLKAEETADGFVYVVDGGEVWITDYSGSPVTSLKFPLIDGEKVNVDFSGIGNTDLSKFSDVETVDLTNVRIVWESTFRVYTPRGGAKVGFTSLEKVLVGGDTEFKTGAFSGTAVTELAFSGSVASNIAELASTVTTVDLQSVTTVEDGAFKNFGSLTTIDLSRVTSIGSSAFQGCESLTELTIGHPAIGDDAFKGAAVSTLTFADGLETIPAVAGVFNGTLTTVNLPESATAIAESAFSGSTGLTGIDLKNVTSIGASAFSGCTGLTTVNLSNVTSIGTSAFQGCEGLNTVTWPAGVTEFPESVFSGCDMLSSITDFDWKDATVIGENAFHNCFSLSGTIEFSSNLQSVGIGAFENCTKLEGVVVKSNLSFGTDAFAGVKQLNLVIEDKVNFSDENANTFDNITYSREFSKDKYATLILPFVPVQFTDGELEVFEMAEKKDDCIVFRSVDEFVPGTPYMARVAEECDGITELTAKDATIIKSTRNNVVAVEDWAMIGQYERIELKASESEYRNYYYISSTNEFLYSEGTLGVNPFRTYIQAPKDGAARVRMMVRDRDGIETEIDVVELEDAFAPAADVYYNLNGCRVLAPVKGEIYIVNGKKVVF